jgi:hypothetical protein
MILPPLVLPGEWKAILYPMSMESFIAEIWAQCYKKLSVIY